MNTCKNKYLVHDTDHLHVDTHFMYVNTMQFIETIASLSGSAKLDNYMLQTKVLSQKQHIDIQIQWSLYTTITTGIYTD